MQTSARTSFAVVTFLSLALAASNLIGCSSGSGSGTTPTPTPTPSSTAVLINMGDTPSDSVLAFAVTISAMSFTSTAGTIVTVPISTPMTMELAHLAGTVAPLTMPSITQGTYNSMSITVSSATVSYMTPGATTPSQQVFSSPMTVSVPLTTPLTVGTNAMVMNLDLNLAASVGTAAGGGLTFTPTFKPSVEMASGASTATPEAGGMMHIVGSVSTTSGSTFTMGTPQGGSMSFTSGSGTQYMGMNGQTLTGMGSMTSSQILAVNATLQTNGTWMANSVTAMMGSGGAMPIGIITATTGNPVTGITLFANNGTGSGMMASYLASGLTVTMGSGVAYGIDNAGISLTGMPSTLLFNATHIAKGQNTAMAGSVGMFSSGGGMMGGGMSGGGINANGIELEPQGLTGTVANITSTGFTLNLASGSAFTLLTGATSVTVYQIPATQMNGLTLTAGMGIEVNGFLFYNAGTYSFVATQMTTPPTP
jgi:hypothetical protein